MDVGIRNLLPAAIGICASFAYLHLQDPDISPYTYLENCLIAAGSFLRNLFIQFEYCASEIITPTSTERNTRIFGTIGLRPPPGADIGLNSLNETPFKGLNQSHPSRHQPGVPSLVSITKGNENEVITRSPLRYIYDEFSPGKAVLLNITRFNDPSKTRDGAQQDTVYLRDLFQKLNLIVQSFPSQNECFTLGDIQKIVQKDVPHIIGSRAPSCLVVFIGSHMQHGKVLLSDGNQVDLHKDILQPIHDNPMLEGVPKIFIVQGCRRKEISEDLPKYNDTIICYSTLPGETSLRDAFLGSLYIRTLTEVFMREAYRSDLKTMLDMIRTHMIEYVGKSKQVKEYQISHYQAEIFGFNRAFYFHII